MLKKIFTSERSVISGVYFLAFGFLLINGGLYFDDFVTSGYNQKPENLIAIYKDLGFFLYWPGYLHSLLFSPGNAFGVYAERFLIFASYLISTLALNEVLKTLPGIDRLTRIFIVLFFAVIPFNSARIALCNINSAVAHAFFYSGWFFLAGHLTGRGRAWRLAALGLFILSFSVMSFLTLYAAVLAYIWVIRKYDFSVPGLLRGAVRHADFILAPLALFLVVKAFFKPGGAYAEGYNVITLGGVIRSPMEIMQAFTISKEMLLSALSRVSIPVLVLATAATLLVRRELKEGMSVPLRRDALLFAAGVGVLLVAAFPYAVLAKMPDANTWGSRHSLTLSLGVALITVAGLKSFMKIALKGETENTVPLMLAVLVAGCVIANSNMYFRFQRQYYKQVALLEHFSRSEELRDNTTFAFDDTLPHHDAYPLDFYRQYVYSGMFKTVFGDESRMGYDVRYADSESTLLDILPLPRQRESYALSGYVPSAPQYLVRVLPGPLELGYRSTMLKLMWLQFTDRDGFRSEAAKTLSLEFKKLSPVPAAAHRGK